MTQAKPNLQPELKIIPFIMAGVCVFISLILLYYLKDFRFFLGVILGGVLAVANFVFLTKIVVKMLDQNYKRKTKLLGLFLIKLLFITLVAMGAFVWLKVPAIGFMIGYASLIPAVLVGQIWGSEKILD